MDLRFISKYRTLLMGLAILWVMFFHIQLNDFPIQTDALAAQIESLSIPLLLLFGIKMAGPMGVDIFIFVSGFGIYYSLSKDSSLKAFYKKRVFRILPYYIPIVLIYSLYLYSKDIWSIDIVIRNVLTINYWSGIYFKYIFDWYIPAILVVYAVSPLLYKLFKINKNITSLSLIVIFYILSYLIIDTDYIHLGLITTRIPVYIAGFWIADYVQNRDNTRLSAPYVILSLVTFIIGFGFLIYLGIFYPQLYSSYLLYGTTIAVVPFCLIYSYLFSLFPNYTFPFLKLCGTYSLTLYIFHERVIEILSLNGLTDYRMDILAIIITFLLAISWTKLIDYVLGKILSKFALSY